MWLSRIYVSINLHHDPGLCTNLLLPLAHPMETRDVWTRGRRTSGAAVPLVLLPLVFTGRVGSALPSVTNLLSALNEHFGGILQLTSRDVCKKGGYRYTDENSEA